jgi:hypothetical protein
MIKPLKKYVQIFLPAHLKVAVVLPFIALTLLIAQALNYYLITMVATLAAYQQQTKE